MNLVFWLDWSRSSSHATSLCLGSDWHLVLNRNFIVDRCIDHMVLNYLISIDFVRLIDIICVFCGEDMMLWANSKLAWFLRLFRGWTRRWLNALLLLIHLLKVFLELQHSGLPVDVFFWLNFESSGSTETSRVWPSKCSEIWIFVGMRPNKFYFFLVLFESLCLLRCEARLFLQYSFNSRRVVRRRRCQSP